jgi:hypothetical protein
MRPVDVTLHYAKQPNCMETEQDGKAWGYGLSFNDRSLSCDRQIHLDWSRDGLKVSRIRSLPGILRASPDQAMKEEDLIKLMGEPTTSAVIDNGTAKAQGPQYSARHSVNVSFGGGPAAGTASASR